MKFVLIFSLLLTANAHAVSFTRCLRLLVDSFLKQNVIDDWPKTKIVENGLNPWIPIRPGISVSRLMEDLKGSRLSLEFEDHRCLIFSNHFLGWMITFRKVNGQITAIDTGGAQEDSKKFWLARFFNYHGKLENYFDSKFIFYVDAPENL